MPLDPSEDDLATFEKRFDRSFLRVYAYLAARVPDHHTAQRLTREVLTSSLLEILDYDEPELDFMLLQNVNRLLRDEAARRAPRRSG
jgi:hypothetical protein